MRRGSLLGMLAASLLMCWGVAEASQFNVDPLGRAGSHPVIRDRPGPDFFEGALLGNGGLGAVVTTRPDAVVVHFGHNNVWDIRIAEDNKDKVGTFKEVFDKVKAIPADLESLEEDPWYADYMKLTQANYAKPYPRPFPCGSLILGFDRRRVELLGYRLDIATGLCVVKLLDGNRPVELHIFVDMARDLLWARLVDSEGKVVPNIFNRLRLLPDPETPSDIPSYQVIESLGDDILSFHQVLPFSEPVAGKPGSADPKDRGFRLSVRTSGHLEPGERVTWDGRSEVTGPLERQFSDDDSLLVVVQLEEGLNSALTSQSVDLAKPGFDTFTAAFNTTRQVWKDYWERSAVSLNDEILERTWYWNHYFLNCAAKGGVNCPGLFANWSFRKIGTSWHGDYHMNYNTQQPFWLPFSSNRVDKNMPYVDLVERLLPLSQKWAKDYYGLRGAYFPHSAYPVEMSTLPYPVPTWGWEICETPWAVQGLWWHYLYTMDRGFLKERAFGPIREAVRFLVDYMKRPEAHGPQWGDDRYHVFPTVPPELYGLRPGFKFNHDCLVDLTLIRFVMNAYMEAVRVLDATTVEAELMAEVRDILDHFPDYPVADSPYGKVFVSVPGENADTVYNTPNSLMTVFPGEDHGLHSPPEVAEILHNTLQNNQNEGGNDLVFLNLQAARIGALDLERFKRQIEYCLLPNGTCTDMAMQVHGRYGDTTPFDFMRPMGVWFENFGLPVVVNECLLQSYNGTIRLFSNWPKDKPAAFRTLRAVGAFLVSASCSSGRVDQVEILSEAGSILRLLAPWPEGARVIRAGGEQVNKEALLELPTTPGESIRFLPVRPESPIQ